MSSSSTHSHVLLVDDDADVLDALGTLLELHGIVVDRAPSAGAALDTLAHGPRPCLALLDIRMPGMSGWDLWRRMQRDPATDGIPVVLVSGEDVDRQAARAEGVLDVLRKPIDAHQVLDLVARVRG
ncbi:MAG: response regulator [Deltaproteobacteria bacterium]|nr:response regulator [Deltaproteobacteria bacterium]